MTIIQHWEYLLDKDVKPALSLSFKLKSATFDQHLVSYKPADEQLLISQM